MDLIKCSEIDVHPHAAERGGGGGPKQGHDQYTSSV